MVKAKPRSVLVAFVVIASLAGSGVARAAPTDQETIARVVELNREAIAQYQKKHFDAAKKVLKEALELCESSGLEHHPVAARTHIHLGIVIVSGFGQREIGSRQFNEALLIDPNITLTPGLATPAAEDVFNEAVVAVSSKGATAAAAAPAPPGEGVEDAENPLVPQTTHATRTSDGAPASDDVARTERRAPGGDDDGKATTGLASRVQLGALVGGGFGWASGMGDVNADTRVPGSFAGAKLGHLELEGGYWLTDEVMLSLEGRIQMITGPTVVEANNRTYDPAKYAAAVFAEATWSPETGRLRPFVSGGVGVGKIRHVVTLPSLKDCGTARDEVCVDTVGAGPLLAGVGGGLMYELAPSFALVAALNTQVAAPDFTFNVDLNVGVAFRL